MVAFDSSATNLVSGDTNAKRDVFQITIATPSPSRVSVSAAAVQGNGDSTRPTISDNGLLVAFASTASNLAAGDSNGRADVFVRDFAALTTAFVNVPSARVQAGLDSTAPAIAGTAPLVAYESVATNLITGDTNSAPDVFRSPALRCDGRRVTVDLGTGGVPTAGADVVRGTAAGDVVSLGAGADRACLGAGDDQAQGGTEGDRIFGSVGLDALAGDAGNDALFGEAQADALDGGLDTDTCDGGPATDTALNCETTTAVP